MDRPAFRPLRGALLLFLSAAAAGCAVLDPPPPPPPPTVVSVERLKQEITVESEPPGTKVFAVGTREPLGTTPYVATVLIERRHLSDGGIVFADLRKPAAPLRIGDMLFLQLLFSPEGGRPQVCDVSWKFSGEGDKVRRSVFLKAEGGGPAGGPGDIPPGGPGDIPPGGPGDVPPGGDAPPGPGGGMPDGVP